MTAENFLSVLAGEEPAVIGSSGKVIKSGPDDRVFVFYADHGAPGTPHFVQILVSQCHLPAHSSKRSCTDGCCSCSDKQPQPLPRSGCHHY